MSRQARVVAPGYPHHVTQRGNRRQTTFFQDSDYSDYLYLLNEECQKAHVAIWAYCLMPNHLHLVCVPESEDGLALAIGQTHRRYTRSINERMEWTGYLWQGRFASFPMDETYLLAAVRYIELNPVRAQLVNDPKDYRWSSARHHLNLTYDPIIKQSPLKHIIGDWNDFLKEADEKQEAQEEIKRALKGGRPLGTTSFIQQLELQSGRCLRFQKPGPKP